ncbi:CHAT domain-containing protein [Fortiea sp. LEGE XX443]|uniref:CHAT domain-containing protein n=1 Tax=Fortiea sp. LEGE XX443 TaxID=1828611 RepID=UPI0018821314|nr:CHAT domain-containing tetratricopeptide repeat protein [Fortiea sp. LEGE XX443]MBE9006206.1 CHAT domain-containing protein [Fortiea sp. LEGE XX443]
MKPNLFLTIILTFLLFPPLPAKPIEAQQYRANLLLNLGNRQLTNGQFKAALASLQESLKIYQQIGDRTGEANTLFRLGDIHFTLGKYQTAISFYKQSLQLTQNFDNQRITVQILEQLSNTYITIGDEKLAKKIQEQAAALKKEIGNPDRAAAFLGNVGLEHDAAAEYKQAIAFHTKQLTTARENNNYQLQIDSLQNIAATYRKIGQYSQAITISQQQLKLANQLSNNSLVNLTFKQIAETYEAQGDFKAAIAFYQQQLELTEKSQKTELIRQLGRAYTFAGQYDQAITLYQEQLASAKTNKDNYAQGIALNNLAFVYLKSSKLTDAQTTLEESVKNWTSLRLNVGNTVDYAAEQANTYRFLQQVLITQNQPEAALEIAEQGSIMAFLQLLGMRLATEPKDNNLKTATKSITLPTITEIQTIAKQQKSTLVKYAIIPDDGLYVWVIQPTGKVTFRKINPNNENTIAPINSIAEVIGNIPNYLGLNSQENQPKQLVNPLLQLHQLLIKPIADLLPEKSQIIFIPQDELWFVPFPALVDISGKYLIEKHTISTVPAIEILKLAKEQRSKTGGSKVVVVGNPTMPKIARAINEAPQPLPQLINTEQEALAIADFFKTKALIGSQATKAAILPLLPKAKIIHLATYGVLDDVIRQGIPGGIALAGENNGLLTASEILNLYTQPKGKRLRARLAFLSAGETWHGSMGNGVLGLSLALMTSGVPSVIVSQWAAPDTPTTVLTTEFYRQLKQNPNKAQALQKAMLATMQQYPNPKYWAGFNLIGEVR